MEIFVFSNRNRFCSRKLGRFCYLIWLKKKTVAIKQHWISFECLPFFDLFLGVFVDSMYVVIFSLMHWHHQILFGLTFELWQHWMSNEHSLKITNKCVLYEIIEFCFIPYCLSFIHASLTFTRFPPFKLQTFYEPQLWNHDSTRLLPV